MAGLVSSWCLHRVMKTLSEPGWYSTKFLLSKSLKNSIFQKNANLFEAISFMNNGSRPILVRIVQADTRLANATSRRSYRRRS